MMSDSSKPRDSGANRSRKADKLWPEREGPVTVDDESYCGKSRRGLKDEKINDCIGSQASELSQPASSSRISGSPAEIFVADSGVTEVGALKSLASFSHGSVSLTGRRRVMEDALTVVPGIVAGEFSFFAVYDGHGGSRVSNACRDRLHQLMMNELKNRKSPDELTLVGGCGAEGVGIEWEKVMRGCFAKMDEEVNERSCVADVDRVLASGNNMVGSTAVVVMVGKEEVVVANCGDSRVVLGRGGVAVPLSRDHKPDRPDELERVEAIGGKVINWNGNRVLGVLATSRSIGDHYLKPYVISEPEITVNKRTELDDFLIIASDGLWDVVSNEVACNVVRKCLDNQKRKKSRSQTQGSAAAEAATMLAGLAMGNGSKDNISIIVIELKKSN